jgi:hypothetical protein
MARGLSELQRTILEMAYKRFLEEEAQENEDHRKNYPKSWRLTGFDGISYSVYIGPVVPSIDSLKRFEHQERLVDLRLQANPFEEPTRDRRDAAWDEVGAEVEAEVERLQATKRELEEKVRAAVPQWWEEPEDSYYSWSPPRFSHYYYARRLGAMSYERFKVASFWNNEEEARRYGRILEEKGLDGSYYRNGGGFLYTAEILKDVFGFEPKYEYEYNPPEWGGQRNAIKFDPERIGKERYNAARASVSRALARLHNRMLIEHSTGRGTATITLEGIAELTGQTVNEVCIAHKINRTDGDGHLLIKGEVERPANAEAEAITKEMQDLLHPPPQPLPDAFLNAILDQVVYRQTLAEEDIREAFEDALERAKDRLGSESGAEAEGETVNESGEPQEP